MADDFKYHIDHHVGLVRPPGLDDVDAAITAALSMQRGVALTAVGDGQFRRRDAFSVVHDHVSGFGSPSPGPLDELLGPRLAGPSRPLRSPVACGRLARDEAEFLVSATRHPLVIALPSPGYVAAGSGETAAVELAAIVRDEVAALAAEGIAYVQLHDPVLPFVLTVSGRERARALGLDPDALLDLLLTADAAVLAGLEVPADFRIGLDLTTSGSADVSGGYDPKALTTFLDRQPFGRLGVEDPFPLEELRPGCVVALGVVDVSTSALESVDDLLRRVDEAAAVVAVDDIAIATNGAFVDPAVEGVQRAKLELVEVAARYFWGNEL
ncbi:hypothetical protein [Amycolatopsis sp. NPDC098790]|uniref:hypothetical protein n=1 Tax=Amycolatopsis sp. NPDC098790 TaxID=3363939 RepID=UPI00382020FD